MDPTTALTLVKARLGINTTVRDTYLTAIVNSVITELTEEKGIVLDGENSYHLMFVVDYSAWRYESKDGSTGVPRHLQFRMHNLIIHKGGDVVV